ncbi:MAG: asparagine synthase (glutamine-hydrolyzing) [Rhodanobacteraceae bacterium]
MCGIAGWFRVAARLENGAERLRASNQVLRHRGPEGEAALEIDHVGMAHTRLAFIDLPGGQQPMWSADRRAVIVFNGEIFNYRELRRHYQARGIPFVTQSDTEVILAAYQAEGKAGFRRLRGMFAFALWDLAERHALLMRDTLGIKPLFVSERDDALLFASEAKGLFALDGRRPELDSGALHLLLNFRYVPGELSLFRGIRQLAPGECFEWRLSGVRTTEIISSQIDTVPKDLEAVLADSVREHLVADVPVGCYLSGGIDSGLMAALTLQCGVNVPTFTLEVGDDPAEARNAAETADALGLENRQAPLGNDEVSRLPQMLWHLETPKVNALQLFRLAELARTQVKAALSGLGGDELFAGYNAHRIFQTCARLPRGASILAATSLCRLMPQAIVPFTERERVMEMGATAGDWPRVYALLRNIWDRPLLRRWLYGPRLLDDALPDAVELVRQRWPAAPTPLAAMMQFEWSNKMVNDLLWQEDRASMAASLEVRVPYVDLAVRAAVDRMGPPRIGKAALREVAQHHLPRKVLRRPKSGFQIDAPTFFDTHLRPLADIWLSSERVRGYGLFNPATVTSLLTLPPQRRYRWHFFMLYLMIQTHLWVEIFEHDRAPGALLDVHP